jgi:hypothetical protein
MVALASLVQLFGLLALTPSLVVGQDGRALDPLNHFTNPPYAGQQQTVDPLVFQFNKNYTV